MIEEIKLMLGDAHTNFSDGQIGLALKMSLAEVEGYCNRPVDYELEVCAERIAIIKLNRMNTEGLVSQSANGVSENYLNDYPPDILKILNRKRRIKVV